MKQKIFFWTFVLLCLWLSIFFFRAASEYKKFEILYNTWAYQEAQQLLEKKEKLSASQMHNLWNTFYKQALSGEKSQEFLQKALQYYSGSLLRHEHLDTRWNYELVKKLLSDIKDEAQSDEEKQEEEKKQEETSPENTGSGSTASGSSSWESEAKPENGSEEQGQPSVLQNARADQYKLEQDTNIEPLSWEEKQELDAIIEALKEEQVYNQQFFGKKSQEKNDFQKAFESLMWWNDEKDW